MQVCLSPNSMLFPVCYTASQDNNGCLFLPTSLNNNDITITAANTFKAFIHLCCVCVCTHLIQHRYKVGTIYHYYPYFMVQETKPQRHCPRAHSQYHPVPSRQCVYRDLTNPPCSHTRINNQHLGALLSMRAHTQVSTRFDHNSFICFQEVQQFIFQLIIFFLQVLYASIQNRLLQVAKEMYTVQFLPGILLNYQGLATQKH